MRAELGVMESRNYQEKREIERLEALIRAGAAMLKEARDRNVRLLSQLQEYEAREQ